MNMIYFYAEEGAVHNYLFLQSLGPKYPLSADRGALEYKVLMKVNAVCPGSVPKPLVYSQAYKVCKFSILGMEMRQSQWFTAKITKLYKFSILGIEVCQSHWYTAKLTKLCKFSILDRDTCQSH